MRKVINELNMGTREKDTEIIKLNMLLTDQRKRQAETPTHYMRNLPETGLQKIFGDTKSEAVIHNPFSMTHRDTVRGPLSTGQYSPQSQMPS